MNRDLIDQVLSCPSLPSLPATAIRVIELTSDPNVRLPELTAAIQDDQGLSAKILKTVNSSFYALQQPCATISKALVLLGLGPVKTLALGFSLVSSLDSHKNQGFDYIAYWRRGLYTAVAAKCLADAAKRPYADEAFLAGLLQDLGVMAMLNTLGHRYLRVYEKSRGDHRRLVQCELADLELQHPDIGAMLAERWKLPEQLVIPVRYHERPTAAPAEHSEMCRCIAVANLVHDALTDRSPVDSLRRLYTRASQWFQIDAPTVDSIIKRVGTGVKEMSRLFNLDTGAFANVDDVLGHAEAQQRDLEAIDSKATSEAGMSALLTTDSRSDPVTGALVRGEFDGAVKRAFHEGAGSGWITTLAYFAIDHFKQIITDHGVEAGDDALVDVASVLMKHFEPLGGAVCRISNDVFAAALATPDLASAVRALEATQTVLATPRAQGSHITVSFGVAHAPSIAGEPIKSESELVVAGTKALHKARQQVPAPLSRNRLAA